MYGSNLKLKPRYAYMHRPHVNVAATSIEKFVDMLSSRAGCTHRLWIFWTLGNPISGPSSEEMQLTHISVHKAMMGLASTGHATIDQPYVIFVQQKTYASAL